MPNISPELAAALDKKAVEAHKQEKGIEALEGQDASTLPVDSVQPSQEDTLPPREPPRDPGLSPPFPTVTVVFDPNGFKITLKDWRRLTPGMIQRAVRPMIRELMRTRSKQSRIDLEKQAKMFEERDNA